MRMWELHRFSSRAARSPAGQTAAGLGKRLIRESVKALKSKDAVLCAGETPITTRVQVSNGTKRRNAVFDPEGYHFLVLSPGPLRPQRCRI